MTISKREGGKKERAKIMVYYLINSLQSSVELQSPSFPFYCGAFNCVSILNSLDKLEIIHFCCCHKSFSLFLAHHVARSCSLCECVAVVRFSEEGGKVFYGFYVFLLHKMISMEEKRNCVERSQEKHHVRCSNLMK
jgi:hypothetical protein